MVLIVNSATNDILENNRSLKTNELFQKKKKALEKQEKKNQKNPELTRVKINKHMRKTRDRKKLSILREH